MFCLLMRMLVTQVCLLCKNSVKLYNSDLYTFLYMCCTLMKKFTKMRTEVTKRTLSSTFSYLFVKSVQGEKG